MNENNEKAVILKLSGRIDSTNAQQVESELFAQLSGTAAQNPVLDAEKLEYISSAGLRVILRLKKTYPDLKIINVSSDVYEILEMTGFTEMMEVVKAYRRISVEGCEVIGEGFNGKVYRIDRDNVVKTYKNADALSEIKHEREVARLALVLGIPTAISYDVVRVGESYGSVFELLNAKSFAKILANEPDKMDFCVSEYVKILRKLHSTEVPEGKLPSAKVNRRRAIVNIKDSLPDALGDKLLRMFDEIPESNYMIHGDCHTKNIVLAGDETLLIDMDTLSVGHPIFELMPMYNAYVGFSEYDPQIVQDFQGYSSAVSRAFWHKSLAAYLGNPSEQVVSEVENKVRILSYAVLIDWRTRHPGGEGDHTEETIDLWRTRLVELLPGTDSLLFEVGAGESAKNDELTIEATTDNLQQVIDFVNERLEISDCPMKSQMQMDLAVEEIFVNIANYAYTPNKGNATVRIEVTGDPVTVVITFIDRGVPYDPLQKADPDVTLSADERKIGGLGIFLTKKVMDEVSYEYRNGQNILRIKKNI